VKINQKLLTKVMESAKRVYVGIPVRARLAGSRTDLTEGERLGLSYLIGVMEALGEVGIDTSNIELEYALVDSEGIE